MATWNDLITAALEEIGVLADGETATASQVNQGLTRLNRLISRLATQKLTLYTRTRSTWSITSGDGVYTVGSGGDVNITRPVHFDEVRYIDTATDPDTEFPLDKLTEERYAALSLKALESTRPQAYYYNPTYPLATLTFWPEPSDTGLQGVIYHWAALDQVTTLADDISLPPGYEEMLMTNLALMLCPTYERQPNPVTAKMAADALGDIKRANIRTADLSFDPAVLGGRGSGRYDIMEG